MSHRGEIPLICVACEARTTRTDEEMHGRCPACGATAMVKLVGEIAKDNSTADADEEPRLLISYCEGCNEYVEVNQIAGDTFRTTCDHEETFTI